MPGTNTFDQKEIAKDVEPKTKSENVEVKNEELNNQKETKQDITPIDESYNTGIIDTDKNNINKEV